MDKKSPSFLDPDDPPPNESLTRPYFLPKEEPPEPAWRLGRGEMIFVKRGRRVGRQAATIPRHGSALDHIATIPRDPFFGLVAKTG